jgi:hypothetical protein
MDLQIKIYSQALIKTWPRAEWSLSDPSYKGLDWYDKTIPKPTEKEFDAAIATATALQKKLADMPSIDELIDDLHTQGVFSTTMTAKIDAVKGAFESSKNG